MSVSACLTFHQESLHPDKSNENISDISREILVVAICKEVVCMLLLVSPLECDVRIYVTKQEENVGMPLAVSLSVYKTTRGHAITFSQYINRDIRHTTAGLSLHQGAAWIPLHEPLLCIRRDYGHDSLAAANILPD
jgi:hypothetical protein